MRVAKRMKGPLRPFIRNHARWALFGSKRIPISAFIHSNFRCLNRFWTQTNISITQMARRELPGTPCCALCYTRLSGRIFYISPNSRKKKKKIFESRYARPKDSVDAHSALETHMNATYLDVSTAHNSGGRFISRPLLLFQIYMIVPPSYTMWVSIFRK